VTVSDTRPRSEATGTGRAIDRGAVPYALGAAVKALFIDSLERDGLALRAHRPGDRRAYNVMLTAEGARRLALIGPRLAATEEAFLDVLSVTDRAGLAAMLARLDQGPPSSPS
jgi:hypothetical protein